MCSSEAKPIFWAGATDGFPDTVSQTSSSVDMEDVARQWPRIAAVQKLLFVAKVLGLSAGFATLILFLVLCFNRGPTLRVSPADLLEDVNAVSWRARLFSFDSDVLLSTVFAVDAWTPFVMGLVSVLVHLQSFACLAITGNWIRFGLWNLALALFGNVGYCGIFGILVGVVSLSTALLSFILFLFHAGPAHLWAHSKLYLSTSRVPLWYAVGAGFWPSDCTHIKTSSSTRSCRTRRST